MKVVSLFSGCGGLDLGFKRAGFEVVFANDISKSVWATYEHNHQMRIDTRSITTIPSHEIPDADGIIGGPPCQSWSLAGAMRGIDDQRGRLFLEYIRVIRDKRPKFFLAENVPGIVSKTHKPEFEKILRMFEEIGYTVQYRKIDVRDYGIPQERTRIFIVGIRQDMNVEFTFPEPTHFQTPTQGQQAWLTIQEAIGDLPEPVQAAEKNHHNPAASQFNHEFMAGGFSYIYMSRNRKKGWKDQSFTIQAGGRHAPLHPSSCPMHKVDTDVWAFDDNTRPHRRLSVRECARIQTFPDDFSFFYHRIDNGYKMIGNAVPVQMAKVLADQIRRLLNSTVDF